MPRFLYFTFLVSMSVAVAAPTPEKSESELRLVSKEKPFFATDGSLIRTMPHVKGVESVHCSLPKGGVIDACRHKTVAQIWYTLEGEGEMWLKAAGEHGKETITPLKKGTALTVPLGYSFQFRNTGDRELEIFIVNTTPWSGDGELIPVKNYWDPVHPPVK